MINKYEKELKVALAAGIAAAKAIMEIYQQDNVETMVKSDDSPVTIADQKADAIIKEHLLSNFPTYGILSEESFDDKKRLTLDYVWIIDPLDGTKDFLAKTGEFAINIALAYQGSIVLGVIVAPAQDEIYYALKGSGSYRIKDNKTMKIMTSEKLNDLIVLRSHFHRKLSEEHHLKTLPIIKKIVACGSSYKACLIAAGKAHYAFKGGMGTKEWDVAASDIIVKEAGGYFATSLGKEICYNKEDYNNYDGYVIMNKYNEDLILKK